MHIIFLPNTHSLSSVFPCYSMCLYLFKTNTSLFHKRFPVPLARPKLSRAQTRSRVGLGQLTSMRWLSHPLWLFAKALSVHGKALWSWMRWQEGRRQRSCTENIIYWSCTQHVDILSKAQCQDTVSLCWPGRDRCTPFLPRQRSLENGESFSTPGTLSRWDLQCCILQIIAWCVPKSSFSDLPLLSAQGMWMKWKPPCFLLKPKY